jgi:tetratricopeptide (TPR) repeat protein
MSEQHEPSSSTKPDTKGDDASKKAKNGAAGHGHAAPSAADALLEKMANEMADGPAKPQTSFGRAMRDILIVAVLLGGGTYFYYNSVTVKEKVQKLAQEASDKLERDDLKSLREAEAKYQEILALDGDNGLGLSGLAETYFHQHRHGLDTRGKAEEYASRAAREGAETAERYAVQAYLDITAGRAADAEKAMKSVLDRGYYHSKIAHAYGWALLEQGRFSEANEAVARALDSDFNAVRYALTLAEIALRQGGPERSGDKAALKNASKVLNTALNPEHEIALALNAALRAKNYGNVDKPAKWIQQVEARAADIGPTAKAYLAWASGELALSLGNTDVALQKADEALGLKKDFPPFFDLKGRALLSSSKREDAIAAFEEGIRVGGATWRGAKWAELEQKVKLGDESALTLLSDLEGSEPSATKGPEYEILRGELALKKGNLADAEAAFTKAADLGDDADILFGLAKVAFLQEKPKGNKANLEKIAEKFGTASEAQATFPELQEYMGQVSLWNYDVPGALTQFEEAEKQFKRVNKPVPEIAAFYDRIVDSLEKAEGAAKAPGAKAVPDWKAKKKVYLESVTAQLAQ